jgi:hypothetical protein
MGWEVTSKAIISGSHGSCEVHHKVPLASDAIDLLTKCNQSHSVNRVYFFSHDRDCVQVTFLFPSSVPPARDRMSERQHLK